MKREPLFVAFSTQKGGVGKTTLTVLVASYLHYTCGRNVAVVDCDYPQHSIVEMRNRDKDLVISDNHYKRLAFEQFKKLGKKAYPVIKSASENAIAEADDFIAKSTDDIDIVFFDLPGTLKKGVIHTLATMDYIFAPISADRVVVESTLQFTSIINDTLMTTGRAKTKGLYLLWNMVDGREKSDLYEVYENVIADLGLQVLKTFLPDSKRFRKELSAEKKTIFRSTLFPIDKNMIKGSKIAELTEEICNIIKL